MDHIAQYVSKNIELKWVLFALGSQAKIKGIRQSEGIYCIASRIKDACDLSDALGVLSSTLHEHLMAAISDKTLTKILKAHPLNEFSHLPLDQDNPGIRQLIERLKKLPIIHCINHFSSLSCQLSSNATNSETTIVQENLIQQLVWGDAQKFVSTLKNPEHFERLAKLNKKYHGILIEHMGGAKVFAATITTGRQFFILHTYLEQEQKKLVHQEFDLLPHPQEFVDAEDFHWAVQASPPTLHRKTIELKCTVSLRGPVKAGGLYRPTRRYTKTPGRHLYISDLYSHASRLLRYRQLSSAKRTQAVVRKIWWISGTRNADRRKS